MQDEYSLLFKVASTHDTSEGSVLQHTDGWATLLTTIKLSGERPPKRSLDSPSYSDTAGKGAAHRNGDKDRLMRQPSYGSDSDSVQLAKRLKGASLKGS